MQPRGVETDRSWGYTPVLSDRQYEIFEFTDGTFAVEVRGGDGSDATITKFDSKQGAMDWVTEQLRKLGVDERWPPQKS